MIDKKVKPLVKQCGDQIRLRRIDLTDKEYLAIGKIIDKEVTHVEGGRKEAYKVYKEYVQALKYGLEDVLIEGIIVKVEEESQDVEVGEKVEQIK